MVREHLMGTEAAMADITTGQRITEAAEKFRKVVDKECPKNEDGERARGCVADAEAFALRANGLPSALDPQPEAVKPRVYSGH